MGAHDFQAEIDTTADDGPRLFIDGALVPLSHYGFEHTPDGDRWSFVSPSPDAGRAELLTVLDQVDPKRLEEMAMERIDVYENGPAPLMSAMLAVLREVARDGP